MIGIIRKPVCLLVMVSASILTCCNSKIKSIGEEKLLFRFMAQAKFDHNANRFSWSSLHAMENGAVVYSFRHGADTIVISYPIGRPDTFVRASFPRDQEKRIVKKIDKFQYLGCYDKVNPEDVYFLFYKSPSDEVLVQLHGNLGKIIFMNYASAEKNNKLENVTNYHDYTNSVPREDIP